MALATALAAAFMRTPRSHGVGFNAIHDSLLVLIRSDRKSSDSNAIEKRTPMTWRRRLMKLMKDRRDNRSETGHMDSTLCRSIYCMYHTKNTEIDEHQYLSHRAFSIIPSRLWGRDCVIGNHLYDCLV
jgi:hypothetical protein